MWRASTTWETYKVLNLLHVIASKDLHVKDDLPCSHGSLLPGWDTEAKLIVAKRHTHRMGTITMTDIYTHDPEGQPCADHLQLQQRWAMDENDEPCSFLDKLTIGQRYDLIVENIGDMYVSCTR